MFETVKNRIKNRYYTFRTVKHNILKHIEKYVHCLIDILYQKHVETLKVSRYFPLIIDCRYDYQDHKVQILLLIIYYTDEKTNFCSALIKNKF